MKIRDNQWNIKIRENDETKMALALENPLPPCSHISWFLILPKPLEWTTQWVSTKDYSLSITRTSWWPLMIMWLDLNLTFSKSWHINGLELNLSSWANLDEVEASVESNDGSV